MTTHFDSKRGAIATKVCTLCDGTVETTEEWNDTCVKCSRKPMFPDREVTDEVVCN